MATDYGRDISGAVDLSPTFQESEGEQLMREVAVRRLSTPDCSLLSAPDEKTVDLREFLSTEQPLAATQLNVIKGAISAALLADSRILSVKSVIEWFPEANYLEVALTIFGADGPFRLTLGITRDKISILATT